MGDANLCSIKWKNDTIIQKSVAAIVKNCLDQCGLKIADVGITYMSDHIQSNGKISETALDHVYHSVKMENIISCETLKTGSSDHFPVLAEFSQDRADDIENTRKITKRSFKHFNQETWNVALSKQDWTLVEKENNLDGKVNTYTNLLNSVPI